MDFITIGHLNIEQNSFLLESNGKNEKFYSVEDGDIQAYSQSLIRLVYSNMRF